MFSVMALGFKEIIWDMGYIWILILVMTIAFIFEELRELKDMMQEKREQKKKKPRFEVIFRQRIE
jgi:hypothetical protein